MGYILHLETSTQQCSVALSRKGSCIVQNALLTENYSHSEKLHLFIDGLIKEAGIGTSQLDAVAISKGPGSYTGLRIGVAAAKGLCFALEIPLIAINTLQILAYPHFQTISLDYIIPMLDARRMEVYTAVFDRKQNWINNTNALVLNSESFLDQLGDASCLIIGNGAEKFKSLTPKINAHFTKEVHYPSAVNMIQLAWKKYTEKDFVALAKFEPFYLKDFQTTAPKK